MLRLREKQTRQVGSEKCQPRDRDKKTWAVKRQNVGLCVPAVDTAFFPLPDPNPAVMTSPSSKLGLALPL